jgi:hypothetical protein
MALQPTPQKYDKLICFIEEDDYVFAQQLVNVGLGLQMFYLDTRSFTNMPFEKIEFMVENGCSLTISNITEIFDLTDSLKYLNMWLDLNHNKNKLTVSDWSVITISALVKVKDETFPDIFEFIVQLKNDFNFNFNFTHLRKACFNRRDVQYVAQILESLRTNNSEVIIFTEVLHSISTYNLQFGYFVQILDLINFDEIHDIDGLYDFYQIGSIELIDYICAKGYDIFSMEFSKNISSRCEAEFIEKLYDRGFIFHTVVEMKSRLEQMLYDIGNSYNYNGDKEIKCEKFVKLVVLIIKKGYSATEVDDTIVAIVKSNNIGNRTAEDLRERIKRLAGISF